MILRIILAALIVWVASGKEFNLTLQGQLIGKSTDANEFPNTKSILYHLVRIEGQAYGGQTGFYDEHVNTVFTQFPQDDLKFPIYEKPWSAMNVNIYLSEGGPYTIMMPPVTTRMYVEFQDNKPAIFEVEIKSAKNKEIKVNLEESSVKKIHGSHPYNERKGDLLIKESVVGLFKKKQGNIGIFSYTFILDEDEEAKMAEESEKAIELEKFKEAEKAKEAKKTIELEKAKEAEKGKEAGKARKVEYARGETRSESSHQNPSCARGVFKSLLKLN